MYIGTPHTDRLEQLWGQAVWSQSDLVSSLWLLASITALTAASDPTLMPEAQPKNCQTLFRILCAILS